MIQFHFENIEAFPFNKKLVKNLILALIEEENKHAGAINVIFCPDDYLIEINRKYLQHFVSIDIC